MSNNLLLLTDSYKFTHWKQYPPKTEKVYSYFESRGGEFPSTIFFGLQYFLKEYLMGQVITADRIAEAQSIVFKHLGAPGLFNAEGWQYILEKHHGTLPVRIKAVPEGTVVPVLNALMTIENTDPKCYWLTNYLETLLVQTWYPTTVATQSAAIRKMILEWLDQTGDPSLIDFKLHDFGFRGVSSVESAGIGGCAHLVNFMGTDTVNAIVFANRYYDCEMAGYSIPAAEHSTITAWGRDHEVDAMRNMLIQFKDSPLVACVSDSFNIFVACEKIWGEKLKDEVMKFKGTLVIRPDSGDPAEVVVKVLNILGDKFGYTKNNKGFKVLNKVRVIQGDGVNYGSIQGILWAMREEEWSADNVAFGMGGALLQKLNRDTQKFAFKCSHVVVNGEERNVYKDPITDPGKVSKKGELVLTKDSSGNFITKATKEKDSGDIDYLETVFEDGRLIKNQTLDEIRQRARKTI
jgi:nicotinamide phosphoribosyltransferase